MTCKHDWHFIADDALLCRRCGTQTGPRTYDQRVQDMLHDVTTIGSAWSRNGERIDPMSVYKDSDTMPLFDDWDVEWDNSTKPKEPT